MLPKNHTKEEKKKIYIQITLNTKVLVFPHFNKPFMPHRVLSDGYCTTQRRFNGNEVRVL